MEKFHDLQASAKYKGRAYHFFPRFNDFLSSVVCCVVCYNAR